MSKYTLGIDFGTLSGRAVLVDAENGRETATSVYEYAHKVIDDRLPETNEKLPPDWALQDPADYLRTLVLTVPDVLKKAKVSPADVIGIGIDFTACTLIPIDANRQPLSFDPRWKKNPHAWTKLWKHHAAQPEANRINELAQEMSEPWLERYGGKISSEWFFSKTLQILNEAPEVYEAADKLIEAGDWVVMILTGKECRNACAAGYKATWSKREGYPSKEFLKALHPRLENVVDEKMSCDIYPVGTKAGDLLPEMAERMGLCPGTAVSVASIDAHVALPAATVTEPGKMVMIMGTSTCLMALGNEPVIVPGTSGYVEDGIIPGYIGFEAGQACGGDHLAWFVENCVPVEYSAEAKERGISVHDLLSEKAAKLEPGESGLIALDWWNGNRSVLVDTDLTGMILGLTLSTKPEEAYRALIEATAFGTRMIIDTYEAHGVEINELYACGGLVERNPVLMQIYSDVTGRELKIAASSQTVALGSAIFGALAAGKAAGGYDNVAEAVKHMAHVKEEMYHPSAKGHEVYTRLYEEYKTLHDYFGRGANDVMKRLKAFRK
ncbi:MAG: ribulokinase [Armatimonadota bacterium]